MALNAKQKDLNPIGLSKNSLICIFKNDGDIKYLNSSVDL